MAMKGGGGRLSIEEGFKPSAHYDIKRLKGGDLAALNYSTVSIEF